MKPALLLLATLPLAGCYLDSRDKSDAEREAEMRVIHGIRAGEVVMAESVAVVPECHAEFRVRRCSDSGEPMPW